MRLRQSIPVMVAVALLGACSPTFNWREVRFESAPLLAWLPCKPDHAERTVQLAGQSLQLNLQGCETGGATFALGLLELPDPTQADTVLQEWHRITRLKARASREREVAFPLAGASLHPAAQRWRMDALRANGDPVQAEVAYFAKGSQVFQAVLYADQITPELDEAFFSGMRLQ